MRTLIGWFGIVAFIMFIAAVAMGAMALGFAIQHNPHDHVFLRASQYFGIGGFVFVGLIIAIGGRR